MNTKTTLMFSSTFSLMLGLSGLGCVDELDGDEELLEDEELLDEGSFDAAQGAAADDISAPAPSSVPVALTTPALVGHWDLDGDVDDSVGFNHGATFGNTSYVPGVDGQGQALRINAQGGGASMDSIVDAFGTDDFAISVWVNYHGDFAGHVRHEHAFTDGWTGGSNRKLDLFAERAGGAYYWHLGPGAGHGVTAPWISQQDQWHHVVMGRTGGQRHMCIDGQLVSEISAAGPTDMSNNDNFYLGRNPYENGGRSFPGALDELRVYDAWVGTSGCECLYADAQADCFGGPQPIGRWTFEPGVETEDVTGNWGDVELLGNASISNGQLHVHGSGNTASGWAHALGYQGAYIREKTLVSWVAVDDLSVYAGSAMTIDNITGDNFDGIVYAERQAYRWMSGSTFFRRTRDVVLQDETSVGQVLQMAIAYRDIGGGNVEVTICREGVQIGQYYAGWMTQWSGNNAEIIFGKRHANGVDGYGALEGRIEEARIYDEAMTCDQVAALSL